MNMAANCFDRFKKIMRITKIMAAICGANILKVDYRVNFHTIAVVIIINAYLLFTVYTIYVELVVNRDWKASLQSLSLVGSAVQGYSKLLTALYGRGVFCNIFDTLDRIYMEYENDKDYLPALRYRINLTAKMLKIVMWIYVATTLGITIYPIIYGQLHGERQLIMQFLVPLLDHTTEIGYRIYVVSQSVCIYLGGFGNFAGDMLVFISITHIPLLKDVLKIKCQKLSRVISNETDRKETTSLLKEIAKCHQNYIKYVLQIEDLYYFIILTQVFTSVVGICCTIFSILIKSWPAAFVYLGYSSAILFTYCMLGNLVEIANDEVVDVMYSEILWYKLSVSEQKLVLLMLRKSQTAATLTVGHIMPLSMNTALQLVKAIYSYIMLLANFLESDDM